MSGDGDAGPRERSDADPFDDLDAAAEGREGDPFAHLDGDEAPGEESADDASDADPFEYVDERGTPDASARSGTAAGGQEDHGEPTADDGPSPDDPSPDDGSASASGERRSDVDVSPRAGDPFADVDVSADDPFESGASAFEAVDVAGVDPDEVWGRLTGEAEPRRSPASADDDVVEVSKHAFCEGCEHFSPPPDVECGHEGTAILEFTDLETVRIANCPLVVERRELGGIEE